MRNLNELPDENCQPVLRRQNAQPYSAELHDLLQQVVELNSLVKQFQRSSSSPPSKKQLETACYQLEILLSELSDIYPSQLPITISLEMQICAVKNMMRQSV